MSNQDIHNVTEYSERLEDVQTTIRELLNQVMYREQRLQQLQATQSELREQLHQRVVAVEMTLAHTIGLETEIKRQAEHFLGRIEKKEQTIQKLTDDIADKDRTAVAKQIAFSELSAQLAHHIQTLTDVIKDQPLAVDPLQIQQLESELNRAQQDNQRLCAELSSYQQENLQLHSIVEQLQTVEQTWRHVQNTISWRTVQRLQGARKRIAPDNTFREKAWFSAYRGLRAIKNRDFNPISIAPAPSKVPTVIADEPHSFTAIGDENTAVVTLPEGSLPQQKDLLSNQGYHIWISANEPGTQELSVQRELSATFTNWPLISVVIPVYNANALVLRQLFESLLAQTYSQWECCVVDGNSNMPETWETLQHFQARDPRIRVQYLEDNDGISGNTNAALAMAQGEFIAFVDHDDTLAPFAFYEVARAISVAPQVAMLYSDFDILSSDGTMRMHPLFKPRWSPEIMLSANYLTHLTVIRATVLQEVGGFDPRFDGAQDWELFLRIARETQEIIHIPKVLYHWRDSENSTAVNIWAKPLAPQRQLRVIEHHLAAIGLMQGRAIFDRTGFIRVNWAYDRTQLVSIIIPSYGADAMLESCVNSLLLQTQYPNFEVLIINNGSRLPEEFPYYANIQEDSRVRVLHYPDTFNYSAVNNFGVRHASGSMLLFLNNDTHIIDAAWLDELVMWANRDEVGMVGAKLLKMDGSIQHAGVVIGLSGFAGHPFAGIAEGHQGIFGSTEWYRDYSAITGACMMIRRVLFDELGGFDENFLLNGSDVELCLRLGDAGYRIVYNPFARLEHIESATHMGVIPEQDFAKSFAHYRRLLTSGDSYYSPNLSSWHTEPTFRQQNEQSSLEFVEAFVASLDLTNDVEECAQ